MGFKTTFKRYASILNPFEYKHLVHQRYSSVFERFFITLLFSLVIFSIILLPKGFELSNDINYALESFETLSVDVDANLNSRLIVSNTPRIIVDLEENATVTDSNIGISNEVLNLKLWPFSKEININNLSDVKNQSDDLAFLFQVLVVLIFPGILITFGLFNLIESILIAFIFACLGFVIIRTFKRDLHFKKLFKISIFASPILFVLNAFFITLMLNFWIPICIYFLFFIIASYLATFKNKSKKHDNYDVKENDYQKNVKKHNKKKTSKDNHPKKEKKSKSRTQEIFGKKMKKDDDDFLMLD